ncbi:hypothetical protein [Methylobacterium sp. 1030]|uniref:hypothetical protein n=1 Tax=Methylobacterium sp. 1030 TaxID=3156404 RepID=UPI00339B6F21
MAVAIGNKFSATFTIDPKWMEQHGVFDPTLDIDAPLFIDPFLLAYSRHKEFSEGVFDTYEEHFSTVYSLLRASVFEGDKAWNAAFKKFHLSEAQNMHGTCLGYSRRSTRGHAFGPMKAAQALRWASNLIEIGVKDPELFSALSLFEKGIGSDLISDMVACIGLKHIVAFNRRIISEIESDLGLKLPTDMFEIRGDWYELVPNPFSDPTTPIILLSDDILKYLPILEDPRDIAKIAEENAELRDRVNAHLSEIFVIQYKNERDRLKNYALRDANAFQIFLDLLKITEKNHYDLVKDPAGIMLWREAADEAISQDNFKITDDRRLPDVDRINSVIVQIIQQFQKLVEQNRLNRLFFVDYKPRHERFAQLLFLAVAISYCQSNKLDMSPEADAGAGPVDFKMSSGESKALVEIKLSTNGKTVQGYKTQLDAYAGAEGVDFVHYVVIDVGKLGYKRRDLEKLQRTDEKLKKFRPLYFIDGKLRESASKLTDKDDE